jgi:uncharacterized protein YegL
MAEQKPFALTTDVAATFAENPSDRVPCILLVDTSGSMRGDPIRELSEGVALLREDLMADSKARISVEIAIVGFGPVQILQDFVTADHFVPPVLPADGDTPMGAAIMQGLDLLRERKAAYRAAGIPFHRPWVFMITDGGPTDAWQPAAAAIRKLEAEKGLLFFAVGVNNANFDLLRQISVREPVKLKGLNFRELFLWLSSSMKRVSQSRVGDEVKLDPPVGPTGWATTT